MKRTAAAVLAALLSVTSLLLASCGSNKNEPAVESDGAETESSSSGGVFNYVIIDEEDPLAEAKGAAYRNIYEADGLAHGSSYSLPRLDVDLPGAAAINAEILADFDRLYGEYFSHLDDLSGEKVPDAGENYTVNVDSSWSLAYDIVTVVVRYQRDYIGGEGGSDVGYLVYHYDALEDSELDTYSYVSYCSALISAVEGAVAAAVDSYEEQPIYPVCTGENKFDVYLPVDGGSADGLANTVVSIEVAPADFELPEDFDFYG